MMTDDTTNTYSNNIEDVNIDHDDFTCKVGDGTNSREISPLVDKNTESIHHTFYKKRSRASALRRNIKSKNSAKPKQKGNSSQKRSSTLKCKAKATTSSSATAPKNGDGDPNWKTITQTLTNPNSNTPYLEHSGPPSSTSHAKSPIRFLLLFFTKEIIGQIVTKTNLYQKQSTSGDPSNMPWKNVSEEEVMAFLMLVVAMGIINLPELDDYWAILVQIQLCHGFL